MRAVSARHGALLGALALFLASGVACSVEPASSVSAPAPVVELDARVTSVDPDFGLPTFAWVTRKSTSHALRATTAVAAAQSTLRGVARTYRLSEAALASATSPLVDDTGKGVILARIGQRVAGREVFLAEMNVALRRDLEPICVTGFLAPDVTVLPGRAALDEAAALRFAVAEMTGEKLAARDFTLTANADGDYQWFRTASRKLTQPARLKPVWFARPAGLVAAYYVELVARGDAKSFVVSADDGSILFRHDQIAHDSYAYRVFATPADFSPNDGPQGNESAPHPTGSPGDYAPKFLAPSLVSLQNIPFSKNDPWLAAAATETNGNNVDAYADLAEPDGFAAGTRDTRGVTSAPGAFDHFYDTSKSPNASPESTQASATHLFYMINFLHDWFYDAGFDEKSGNPQADNFKRGGRERDPIHAEAQDFDGRNNADAYTPSDGASPRIQMYVFAGRSSSSLVVSAPPSIAGSKGVGVAGGFGPQGFDLSGELVLAVDGAGPDESDGCETLTNAAALSGKIALVHRGTCEFAVKVKRAQDAGALGAIIANVAGSRSPDTAPPMAGNLDGVTIPSVSVDRADAAQLEAALVAPVTVQLKRELALDLDGALDSTIVSHEWGHVLSNRLIGNGNGLNTNQAGGLGEGWGDFVSLLLLARADDVTAVGNADWSGVYPTGGYATSGGGEDFYFGIRRFPYSVDFSKNPLTFKHIEDNVALPSGVPVAFGEGGERNAEVHNSGEVWASMLWECYVALLRDTARLTFAQAQERMKRYLVASLKLTPKQPTLLEARDAVLAAVYASDPVDFRLFAQAFARRGAGVGAKGPGRDSSDNSGVVESFFSGASLEILTATLTDDVITCDKDGRLDDGETGTLALTVRNGGTEPLAGSTLTLVSSSELLQFDGGGVVAIPPSKPFETVSAKVTARLRGARAALPIEVSIAISDPAFAAPGVVQSTLAVRAHADEATEVAAEDRFETRASAWKVGGDGNTDTTVPWRRVDDGRRARWTIPNNGEPSDQWLVSPELDVQGTELTMKFRHRYSFESGRGKDFDGGVIEITTDGGKSWRDIGEVSSAPGYDGKFDPEGSNPVRGRKGFVNSSPGYPEFITTSVPIALAQPGMVRVRFRVGTDDNAAAPGWEIEEVAFTGLANTPFPALVDDRAECLDDAPTANAGAPQSVAPKSLVALRGSGSSPFEGALSFYWTEVLAEGAQPVELNGPTTATPSFLAPLQGKVTLALRVDDGALLSRPSMVDVTVTRAEDPSCACSTVGRPDATSFGRVAGVAFVAVLAAWRRRRRAS